MVFTQRLNTLLTLYLILLIPGFSTANDRPAQDEHTVKAVLIFKISQFINWENQQNILLCHVSNDQFTQAISAMNGRKAGIYTIQTKALNRIDSSIEQCQITYLADGHVSKLFSLLAATHTKPILTISDIKDFALSGGMIELSSNGSKIQFLANYSSIKQSGIQVESSLLEMFTLVNGGVND